MTAISAIPGLAQAGLGIGQLIQAKKYEKEKRPTYETPAEVKEATELARREASRGRLKEQDIFEQALSGKLSEGVSALKETSDSPVDIASGITRMVGSQNRALTESAVAAERIQRENVARLQQSLGLEASYTDKGFVYNQYEPYMNAMRAAASLRSAGITNIFQGADSGIAGGMQTYFGGQYQNQMESYMTNWQRWKESQPGGGTQMPPVPPMPINPYINNPYPGDIPNT